MHFEHLLCAHVNDIRLFIHDDIISYFLDCSFLSFKCSTDLCVSRDKWCDGIVDCPDGKDEPDKCLRSMFFI